MKRLVILGGGYAGLTVARQLVEKGIPDDTAIYLIDRMPFQGLKTEYYSLAAGTAAEKDVRLPFPVHPCLLLHFGEITGIDLDGKLVFMRNAVPVAYDWLVIALGSTDNYYGIPGAEEHTCSLQSLSASRRAYQQINDVHPYGHVTIVGGGLSGVELAAELRESRPDLNVRVLDRGSSILSSFPEKLQTFVRDWFVQHEVEMISDVTLTRVEEGLLYNGEKPIRTDAAVWTAGIQPAPLVRNLPAAKDVLGRLKVNDFHQLPAHPEVFIAGDCASLPFSPSAVAAEAQGRQIAEIIRALWRGEAPRYAPIRLTGFLGSLGKKSGFGVMGKQTVMVGIVPRTLKSGILWRSKRHSG